MHQAAFPYITLISTYYYMNYIIIFIHIIHIHIIYLQSLIYNYGDLTSSLLLQLISSHSPLHSGL